MNLFFGGFKTEGAACQSSSVVENDSEGRTTRLLRRARSREVNREVHQLMRISLPGKASATHVP